MVVVGVDPGNEGAIAFLDRDGSVVRIEDMPMTRAKGSKRDRIDVKGCAALLAEAEQYVGIHAVVIEQVQASPGAGVAGMFRFGYGAGAIEGIAHALGLPVVMVSPAVWKGALRLPGGAANKPQALELARRRWPDHVKLFTRVKDAGRAEAALIAWYGIKAGLVLAPENQVVKYPAQPIRG